MTREQRGEFRRRMEKLRDIVLGLEAVPDATEADHPLVREIDERLNQVYDRAVEALVWARRKYDQVA